MPLDFYANREFTIDTTTGEAEQLFGQMPGMTQAPRMRLSIDAANGHVTFKVDGAGGDPGRDFAKEAEARYIDGNSFGSAHWPDEQNDMIIGHINWKQTGKQQLFLMWVREDPASPEDLLKLGFFFFANRTRFSCCEGDMTPASFGQGDGGGTGGGPK